MDGETIDFHSDLGWDSSHFTQSTYQLSGTNSDNFSAGDSDKQRGYLGFVLAGASAVWLLPASPSMFSATEPQQGPALSPGQGPF